jgi:hypothetical protein
MSGDAPSFLSIHWQRKEAIAAVSHATSFAVLNVIETAVSQFQEDGGDATAFKEWLQRRPSLTFDQLSTEDQRGFAALNAAASIGVLGDSGVAERVYLLDVDGSGSHEVRKIWNGIADAAVKAALSRRGNVR